MYLIIKQAEYVTSSQMRQSKPSSMLKTNLSKQMINLVTPLLYLSCEMDLDVYNKTIKDLLKLI